MAPFSRFCTLAFALGGQKKNRIMRHDGHTLVDTTQSLAFQDVSSKERGGYHSQHSVASLASDVLMVDTSVPSVEAPTQDTNLSHLCKLLGATPTHLLSLQMNTEGSRGMYLNQNISQDDILLSIPLDSCLRDDTPPAWFVDTHACVQQDCPAVQPSAWASRLAASLIDQQLSTNKGGMDVWLQLLPDSNLLRASLPIHWDEDLVSSTRCTALELAVDSAYFSRADAVADLTMAIPTKNNNNNVKELCDNALDIVQTRVCRFETLQHGNKKPIRLLAPIFDMINHANPPNAAFAAEGENLIVRALKDLQKDEEICIDYGDATRPHWKCCMSYGFVPEYNEQDEDANLAEVYIHGKRFEVGPSTIPLALVEAFEAVHEAEHGVLHERSPETTEAPETILTPEIALRIANRLSQVAFQLLLEPSDPDEELAQFYQDAIDEDDKLEERHQEPQDIISARIAASLRWAQHRTLLACASGLEDLAGGGRCIDAQP